MMRMTMRTKDKVVTATSRKPTNVTIDPALLDEARALKLNVSRAAEAGIANAINTEKSRRWQDENAATIELANKWVDEHGLPLRTYRVF